MGSSSRRAATGRSPSSSAQSTGARSRASAPVERRLAGPVQDVLRHVAAAAKLAMSGKTRSGTASAGGVAPEPSAVVAPVDPDRGHAERLGGHVVVEQALGDVEDPLARDVDALEGELEVGEPRLVALRLFGRDRPSRTSTPSRRFEAANRSSSQFVMTPSR